MTERKQFSASGDQRGREDVGGHQIVLDIGLEFKERGGAELQLRFLEGGKGQLLFWSGVCAGAAFAAFFGTVFFAFVLTAMMPPNYSSILCRKVKRDSLPFFLQVRKGAGKIFAARRETTETGTP